MRWNNVIFLGKKYNEIMNNKSYLKKRYKILKIEGLRLLKIKAVLHSIFQFAFLIRREMCIYVLRTFQQELECSQLQNLLFCMHAFLTAKVAAVDPTFLTSTTP